MKIEKHCPGGMTRYDFGLVDVEGGRLFVWLNSRIGGVCVVLPDCDPAPDWLAEKLRCSEYDAGIVAGWIHDQRVIERVGGLLFVRCPDHTGVGCIRCDGSGVRLEEATP